eukprot:TRINITY_DN2133_c0_g1_i1.p1 TRINITY_DN2133_c0_g1~~TRINITY_DN2133_c0_g1_i1.p1  ORF type:complete len:495 (+),score=165.52 TRINITY_DN2133_c0_g1_i1:2-1486(+)
MNIRNTLLAGVAVLAMAAGAAQAKELTFAFQGDANSMDPYNLNETFTLGYLANIYEGLIRRGPNLEIEPALAESWEIMEPTRWRFHLRKGVKFHDGGDFNADDVLFSYERTNNEDANLRGRVVGITEVIKVDDYTVDFVTEKPNPIIYYEWDTWFMMDKEWSEANGAATPTNMSKGVESYAAHHENGTGAFTITERQVDVKTVMVPFEGWWDTPVHNLTEVIMTPIGQDATRVAALLSGEVDMVYPVPVQDIGRVEKNDGTSVLVGPELRTIFLFMDQFRDELLYSSVKGKNPFKDLKVRQAMYHAIDIEAIKKKIMRGLSDPSALMISPKLFDRSEGFTRLPYDRDKAKALLAEAGYPDGFETRMDCPNDRYVNDEAICQAVVSMLAKIGIKVNLLAQPKALYFKKVLAPSLDTSFYLLGWTPGSFDSWNPMFNLHGCYDAESGNGKFNLGRYCNPEFDALTAKVLSETDSVKRNAMIRDLSLIHISEPTRPY